MIRNLFGFSFESYTNMADDLGDEWWLADENETKANDVKTKTGNHRRQVCLFSWFSEPQDCNAKSHLKHLNF